MAETTTTTTTTEKQVMIVAIDESDHSFYALEWTLDHFFAPFASNPPFKLVIVHSKPTPSSVVGLAGPGAADVIPYVEVDLKHIAARIVEKAKGICSSKLYPTGSPLRVAKMWLNSCGDEMILVNDVIVEVIEGDARNVLCDAVDRHHAAILVVGSHGYGAIKRAVLGSVSDYCAHHAHCNVMIVKKPKIKEPKTKEPKIKH